MPLLAAAGALLLGAAAYLTLPDGAGPASAAPAAPAGQAPAAAPTGFQPVFEQRRGAVVLLEVERCDGASSGTGFFIDPTHVLTAAHVVEGASHLRATVDGRPISARVIGVDRAQDLALLRTDSPHTGPVIELSQEPGVGAPVAAIGFPGGSELTLTTGAVSGLDRELEVDLGMQRGLIQTDAAVNPGNSGGPLVDAEGRAVGVVVSRSRWEESTAFAVGADAAAADVQGWTARPEDVLLERCNGSRATADAPTSVLTGYSGASYAAVQYADATCTAPMSKDNAGNPVGYFPAYAIDGDPSTAWRCPGTAVGERVRLQYPYPVTVRAVGLIPGYSKYDPADGQDRYPQNRRVSRVRWTFDDGSSVDQLVDSSPGNRTFQTVGIPETTTSSVTMTVLSSSGHGGRDFTAVSEIGVYGS